MKKYKISNELAPNITKLKKKGALKFMFHRYQSGVTGISIDIKLNINKLI